MIITSDLVEAYLNCPTKCFLKSRNEVGSGNAYADWICVRNASYQSEGQTRLRETVPVDERISGPLGAKQLKSATWRLATDSKVLTDDFECKIHAAERISRDPSDRVPQFIPTRFISKNKLGRNDKLLLAFDALVLSETLGRKLELGKIVHGDDHVTVSVKTAALESDLRKITAGVAALLSSQAPPELVLNRHCAECEFQKRCRQKAIENDDLSLLAGITEDERIRYHRKGIFTVKQLSYTFRPRRKPKRAKNPGRLRYPALQALAIRENTVYIHGGVRLPDSKVQVYLDIEGLPDADSYFPTHSNGLKEIGRFLGFERTEEHATGLHSIMWRKDFEGNRDPAAKARLLQYNYNDCRELRHIANFIRSLDSPDSGAAIPSQPGFKTARTEELATDRPRWNLFRAKEYASEDLKKVAKCAYFDYQRTKVFVRTNPQFKIINKKRRGLKRTALRVNKVQSIESQRCPECRSKDLQKGKQMRHDLVDLKFFNGGVKRWVIRTISWRYSCSKCKHRFSSEERSPNPRKFGHGLLSWCVYSNVACGLNMGRVEKTLEDVFGLAFNQSQFLRSKRYAMALYQPLCDEILQSILESPMIHVDETTVRLRQQNGYVWVMTTTDRVYYFYKPSREAAFLKDMLANFKGVLISDFYTAYDPLKCEQQKCIVHFVRDIDDDLLKNPFDVELQGIAQKFGVLLREVIATVDKCGLKSRYLRKHKASVARFLKTVASADFVSPLADKYKKRLQKSGGKMFTFLDHDSVPWNNNNAEHAIKRFAKYRRDADGRFTERTLQEYLVLATVLETCEFNNLDVLKFLLSKELTLQGLLKMAGR